MTCLTIKELNNLKPCPESGRRVRAMLRRLNSDPEHCFTAAEAREAGCTFADIIWVALALARTDKAVGRKLRMFGADCAARVLHIFEREHPNDARPRKAIKAARDYANGRVSDAAMDASAAASASTAANAYAAAYAAFAAAYAAADAADAARTAARAAASAIAVRGAERNAAWFAARDAEEQWQFDRIIAWLSDDEPKPLHLPAKPKVERVAA